VSPAASTLRRFCGALAAISIAGGVPAAILTFAVGASAADGFEAPLEGARGDPARGREIAASRQTGLCVLCHALPAGDARFQGNLAPDLAGVGSRLGAAQLRQRLVDPARSNPDTVMPAYTRTEGLPRVAQAQAGRPILSAQQVEDVVSWLETLK